VVPVVDMSPLATRTGQQLDGSMLKTGGCSQDREPSSQECIAPASYRSIGHFPAECAYDAENGAEHERQSQVESCNGTDRTFGNHGSFSDSYARVLHSLGNLCFLQAGLQQGVQLLLHLDFTLQASRANLFSGD
jgi:hypothetical protein